MALERTLKLTFKTTGSSSPSVLTKRFLPGHWRGLGPLGPPCLRQWLYRRVFLCVRAATSSAVRVDPQVFQLRLVQLLLSSLAAASDRLHRCLQHHPTRRTSDAVRLSVPHVLAYQLQTSRPGQWYTRWRMEKWTLCNLRLHISGTASPNVTKFSVLVTCACGYVLPWWCCSALCTSGLLDDIISHNGLRGAGDKCLM